jgi:hypothetical protein
MHGMMMPRDGPTLSERAEALLDGLEGLRGQFKDGIARVVGGSVAQAVRDWVRSLLGGGRATRDVCEMDDEGRPGWGGLWGEDEAEEEPMVGARGMGLAVDAWVPQWLGWCLVALAPIAAWLVSLMS